MTRTFPSLSVVAALVLAGVPAWSQESDASHVIGTKHNLSAGGPGTVKVAGSGTVCTFCHTPHAASPAAPLWNRLDSGQYYTPYKSSTLVATVGQPTGSSRVCLGCHDGTIALTQTATWQAAEGTLYITANDRGYIGTDLSDDHPISFRYDSTLAIAKKELVDPAQLPPQLALDDQNQLQCTTCHDAHDNRYGKFLKMDNTESRMCQSCHNPLDWTVSAHAMSTASLSSATRDKWDNLPATTVRQAACEACHRPHSAGGRQRLLRHEAGQDNCLNCHDGTVAAQNLLPDMGKISTHPAQLTVGVHDPTENPATMQRHVECVDCHNPHRTMTGSTALAPNIKPSMKGATGVSGSSSTLVEATYEYQVCYKCHGAFGSVATPPVDRVIVHTGVAEQFATGNPSFHPVEGQGHVMDVPSLIAPLRITTMIYCTDCHGSDSATGPKGPHGSTFRPILVKNYSTIDNTAESPTAYALCYTCHSRDSILGDASFPLHSKHLAKNAPCSACHDAHGLSASRAPAGQGAHLINFDSHIVFASTSAGSGPTYTSSGRFAGSCTLLCHSKDHNNTVYPVVGGMAPLRARPAGKTVKR